MKRFVFPGGLFLLAMISAAQTPVQHVVMVSGTSATPSKLHIKGDGAMHEIRWQGTGNYTINFAASPCGTAVFTSNPSTGEAGPCVVQAECGGSTGLKCSKTKKDHRSYTITQGASSGDPEIEMDASAGPPPPKKNGKK